MSFITKAQREEIQDLAQAAKLQDPRYRDLLLDGIDPAATGLIPFGNNPPLLQLAIDLNWVSEHERIADGTVPLLVWLRNAARLTRALAQGPSLRRWADYVSALAGGEPLLKAERDNAPHSPLVVTLGAGNAPLVEIKETVLFETSEIIPFVFLESGTKVGRSVAHLSVPVFEGGVAATYPTGEAVMFKGTGWVLGARHVITNHHVINARKQGAPLADPSDFLKQGSKTKVRFDFDDKNALGQEFSSTAVVAWDAQLDYAILETSKHLRPPLRRIHTKCVKNNGHIPVNIIQHPDGGPKMIAIRNNLVTETTDNDICYLTDTKLGSSGSPVLDDQWIVVALHRGSVVAEGVKYFGASTAYVNIGTQIASIEDHLGKNFGAVWDGLSSV